jgi:hypothetical protein
MSVMGRVKGGCRSAAGRTWDVTKRLLVRIAIAVAVMVVAIALAKHGESPASGHGGAEVSGAVARPVAVHRAILSEGWTDEQLLLCRYRVDATFGVSIFTETDMGARRLARLYDDTEVNGSCGRSEGSRTVGCAGLRWETQWIRVRHGDTVGYSPASCLVKEGIF